VSLGLCGEQNRKDLISVLQSRIARYVAKVLLPGRYRINALVVDRTGQGRGAQSAAAAERENYAEIIELYDIVTVPAGYKGLLTELAADMPKKSNQVVSDDDRRGVQSRTLEPGSYYLNPYVQEVRLIDCRLHPLAIRPRIARRHRTEDDLRRPGHPMDRSERSFARVESE
jgi:hypothetical protein